MSIGFALGLTAITQQMNQVQEAVNGAFKPLISYACEMPQRLNAVEAMQRCASLSKLAQNLEGIAREGMDHLLMVRESGFEDIKEAQEILPQLKAFAISSRASRMHAIDMFAVAEKSLMWSGYEGMVNPVKRKYVRALTAIENTALQISQAIKEASPAVNEFALVSISREESQELIRASHRLLSHKSSEWM